jgi:hypothetical protein
MISGFSLGLIWGLGSVNGDRFRIRHKDYNIIKRLADELGRKPYPLHQPGKEQWAAHVPVSHPLYAYLVSLGWASRWNVDRPYPAGDIDHGEFIRGFVSVHHTLSKTKLGRSKALFPRLRIYGSKTILEAIDRHFVASLGTTPKTVQKHGRSEICHILYYQSKKEVPVLLNFLGLGNGARES